METKNNISNESDTAMASAKVSIDEHKPLSPGHGGFVIQFRVLDDVEAGRFTGRVEHVASGEVGHFQTSEALAAFVRHVLCGIRAKHKDSELEERGTG